MTATIPECSCNGPDKQCKACRDFAAYIHVRLLRGRVCIVPDVVEVSPGGIIIPNADNAGDRGHARTGVVVAMGPPALDAAGAESDPGFGPGDRVVYLFGQINTPLPGFPRTAWCAQEEVIGVIE